MSESGPFRDGMNAALLRIDRLAGENAELRDASPARAILLCGACVAIGFALGHLF